MPLSQVISYSLCMFSRFRNYCAFVNAPTPNAPTKCLLTRALEGGGGGAKNALPSGFSRIGGKRRRAAPPFFFQHLLRIELHTLCKNLNPRAPKVRSPGQVKVKNGFLTLRLRSGHTRYPIGFKPSVFHKITDTYKFLSRIFDICHQRSGQFRDLTIISQWAKIPNRSYWMIMRQNHLNPS